MSLWRPRRVAPEAALMLDDAVTALGRRHEPGGCLAAVRHAETVPVDRIIGSMARHGDFDRDFRPLHAEVRARRDRLARLDPAAIAGAVSLVRVGENYFVEDGHHRISLAGVRGQLAVDAAVRPLCTIAWACACLTTADLTVKAAERDFLTEVDLPDPALRELWLDDPVGYRHLADAARGWVEHATHRCVDAGCVVDPDSAAAWWDLEVLPRAADLAAECHGESTAARYLRATDVGGGPAITELPGRGAPS